MAQRLLRGATLLGGATLAAGVVSDFFLFDVDAGKKAVMFDKVRGLQKTVIGEGTHPKIPFLQIPYIIDIRSRPRTIQSVTGTKDLQMVNIALRVLSRPDDKELSVIIEKLGVDFDEKILPSIGNEVLKSIVAQYNAEELLSKREIVSHKIRDELENRAREFNLILDDVSITHLTFGREFAKAIEHKQVAQQEAETQAYVVAKAEQERRAAIIRAEGEAEAAELISKAMTTAGEGFIEVRRIDAAKEVAAVLAKSPGNVVYLPSGGKDSNGNGLLLNIK